MTSLINHLRWISQKIDTVNESIGRFIAWLTLAMVCITFLVVVLRYVFNIGWIALQESVVYLHGLVFLLGIGYTLKHDKHVRVDIFYREMQPRTQALVNLLGTLVLLFPTGLFLLWISWGYVVESWIVLEGSREAGGLPGVFLLKTVILLMAVLLLLQGVSEFLRSLLTLTGHFSRQTIETHEA
jgi:TRAP-type mannitol/chloroaromatic compound transport system permease small subunit